MQTALLLTAALASEDEPPGGLAQRHVSGGPASISGLGGQGHGTQSHRPQGGRAETRLQHPPPCPALSRSCACLYVRHSAAAGAAFPDGPSSRLATGLGLAGRQLGRPARGSGFFLLGPGAQLPWLTPTLPHLEEDTWAWPHLQRGTLVPP